jgi:TetR/AcrR family transcriptional regulator, regulator of cefoperazone and chloramphenicol sensitivity
MTSMRRHNAESGYPRGEETRARIIRTAIALFGEKGFAGVSTREIAKAAEVPAPSIQYYFENKEGLYGACLDDIQASALDAVRPALERIEELLAANAATDRLIEGYCNVLDSLADFLFSAPDAASRALFVAQLRSSSAAQPTPERGSTLGKRIQDGCAAVILRIAQDGLTDEEAKLVCTTVNGQLFIIHVARGHVSELIGWDEITPARIDALKTVIRKQTTVVLNSYRPRRDPLDITLT